jgi:hypothetical protein
MTVQTLASLPGAALLIWLVWRLLDGAFGWDTAAVPTAGAGFVGLAVYIAGVGSARPRSSGQWVSGGLIMAINALFLALAVLGLDWTLDRIGFIERVGNY